MTRLKMLSLGALLGAAALSFAATTPVPQPKAATTIHADSGCPECFPPPPLCDPGEPCPFN